LKGNEKKPQAVVLDTNLIIRQSCGCKESKSSGLRGKG